MATKKFRVLYRIDRVKVIEAHDEIEAETLAMKHLSDREKQNVNKCRIICADYHGPGEGLDTDWYTPDKSWWA